MSTLINLFSSNFGLVDGGISISYGFALIVSWGSVVGYKIFKWKTSRR